jgi:phage shock protein C
MENKLLPEEKNEERYLPIHVTKKRKLERSVNDKIFLGLCGGIAYKLNVEPTLIRILFILSILIGGWGIVFYILAAMLIPKNHDYSVNNPEEQYLIRRTNNKILLGGSLMLIGFFFTFNIYGIIQYFTFVGIPPSVFWAFALIGAGVYTYTRSTNENSHVTPGKFVRMNENRRIAGICSGFAYYLNIDTNMCRMLWIIFSFVTLGVGLVIYLVIWLALPLEGEVGS